MSVGKTFCFVWGGGQSLFEICYEVKRDSDLAGMLIWVTIDPFGLVK